MWQTLHNALLKGDVKALARSISLIENETAGFEEFLESLPPSACSIVGITGPPGAGKSTLTDALVGEAVQRNKKAAVLCVDPSSPFHHGALLGDRIRMSQWYNHPSVFIRSLANRGSLGGLHPKIIEITSLVAAAGFDYVFVETVGVGQSEVDIAGLANVTVVVLVPESGDEVQSMKAGLMEIADIFVVNKSDRPGADEFAKNLQLMLHNDSKTNVDIVKTIATQKEGIATVMEKIERHLSQHMSRKKAWLLAERAFYLIQQKRMQDIDKTQLMERIQKELETNRFNLYSLAKSLY